MSYPAPAIPRHAASAWFSLVLLVSLSGLPAIPLEAQPQISIESQLVEIETYFKKGQASQAAGILDRILARLDAGEAMPAGLSAAQIRLAAATAHFQSRNYARAAEIAATVPNSPGATPQIIGEAAMIQGLGLALEKKFDEALPAFKAAAAYGPQRDRALLYAARAAYQAGKPDEAIAGYNRLLESGLRDRDWGDAALALISLHLERGNLAEAKRGLALMRGKLDLVDNLAGLNILYLQLGDSLFAAKDYDAALAAYRTIYPRERLLNEQKAINAQLDAQIARITSLPRPSTTDQDLLLRLTNRREQAGAALERITAMADYDNIVRYRLGLCFQERGGTWQAALIYEDLLTRHPDPAAYYNLVRAYADAGRFTRVRTAAERFQKAFPAHELVPKAMFLAALAAGRTRDVDAQLRFLDQAVEAASTPDLRETILLMRANALFTLARYDDAGRACANYLKEFPKGRFAEENTYLEAMADLNLGRASRAEEKLKAYLAAYPKGKFDADARYRLATTAYARQDYQLAIKITINWLLDFPTDHHQRGEILSLQGDAFSGANQIDDAVASYTAALQIKLPDELLGYVLDELTRLHQTRRDYDTAVAIWTDFARENPDHPYVINAAYWIGRLRARQGKNSEAIDAQAGILRRYVTEPQFDNVERLLIEFASHLAQPARTKKKEDTTPPVSILELYERVETLLINNRTGKSPTSVARVLFTQAEIAILRNEPDRAGELYRRIATEFTPDTLPPGILGKVGDYLFRVGQPEAARPFFQRIVDAHARSVFADFGYQGLGQVALRAGRPQEALDFFTVAVDKTGARFKLREITLGRGYALLALGRLDEARQTFESVAANRAWRGESTAESLVALGDTARKSSAPDAFAKAQAYYQRVYIGYKRFLPWVAAAYTRGAESFLATGQRDEAITTLQRMMTDDRLSSLPAFAQARDRLRELIAQRDGGLPSTPRFDS